MALKNKNHFNNDPERLKSLQSKKNRWLNAYAENSYHIGNTCKATNITYRTYYNWKEGDDGFAKAVEALRDRDIDLMEDAMKALVKEKNPAVVMFGLKTRGAKRGYQDKQQVEVFGSGGIQIHFHEGNDKIVDSRVIDIKPEKLEELEEDNETHSE